MPRRIVIKIGGSVLQDENSFAPLAARLVSYLRDQPRLERAYVVVSAMKGVTDRTIDALAPDLNSRLLLRERLSGIKPRTGEADGWDRPSRSLNLLWGEIESAFLLKEAIERNGIPVGVITQLGLFPILADGDYLHARIDFRESRARFPAFDLACGEGRVIILSGFGAVNRAGEPVLLGRNASDYVAAVMSRLDKRIDFVLFLKDVGGIYEEFGTERQRLVERTSLSDLKAAPPGQVLDGRVLDAIRCDFRVTGAKIGRGGTVVRRAG